MKITKLLSFFFLLIVTSCVKPENGGTEKPDEPTPIDQYKPSLEKYGNVVLAKDVIFIDDVLAKYVEVIDESSLRIHVTGGSKAAGSYPDNMIPKTGSVIYAPVSETTPVGFMGKVKSASESNGDYIVTTEGVDIGEVFEELDITTTLDVTEFMDAIVDEEGNEIQGEDFKGELWENFAGEDDPETKASTPELTRKFNIPKHPIIDGNLYITASADVHVKILFGKPEEYSIALNLRSGVEATIKMPLKSFEDTQKLLNVPIKWKAFNVGPLVVIPTTAYKVDLKLEADASLESGFKWQFQNNTFKCSGKFGSEPKAEIINNDSSKDRYLKVLAISGEATFTFQQRLEQSISIYNDRFLKIGVNTGNDIPITFKAEVDMTNKDLLKVNPSVTVGHLRNSSVFVESMFISGMTSGTSRWSKEFPSNTTTEVDLLTLPALVKPNVQKEKKKITVEVDKVKPKAIVKAKESGMALFHKDNQETPIKLEPVIDFPIENCLSESIPKEKPVEKTVTFDNLPDSDDYIVQEYVKTEKGDIYYNPIKEGCPDDNHVHAIDLGLSVKWACYNVGATIPEEYGGYYTWDNAVKFGPDMHEDTHFDWSIYNWRVPTIEEWIELMDNQNCIWTWATLNGVDGYKVQSKKTGYTDKWIFLPAAGTKDQDNVDGAGVAGCYWSSSFDAESQDSAFSVSFEPGYIDWLNYDRRHGRSVRPVSD